MCEGFVAKEDVEVDEEPVRARDGEGEACEVFCAGVNALEFKLFGEPTLRLLDDHIDGFDEDEAEAAG